MRQAFHGEIPEEQGLNINNRENLYQNLHLYLNQDLFIVNQDQHSLHQDQPIFNLDQQMIYQDQTIVNLDQQGFHLDQTIVKLGPSQISMKNISLYIPMDQLSQHQITEEKELCRAGQFQFRINKHWEQDKSLMKAHLTLDHML